MKKRYLNFICFFLFAYCLFSLLHKQGNTRSPFSALCILILPLMISTTTVTKNNFRNSSIPVLNFMKAYNWH